MTDTAPQRTQYDLVPGMTAYRLNAILKKAQFGVYTAAIAAVIWYVFAHSTRGGSADRIITYLIVAVPSLMWLAISILLMRRRDAAETAAGYTTRAGVLHRLDQVDPVTGVVIRRAGSAVLTKPGRQAGGDATGLSAGAVLNGGSTGGVRFEGTVNKPARLLTIGVVVVVILLVIGIPLVVASSNGGDIGVALAAVLAVLGITVVVFAIGYGGTALRTRLKTSAVARRRPDAFVFLSRRTPELGEALDALVGKYPSLAQSVTVSVGPLGVELWRGSADEPRAVIPWSAIGHVHPGRLLVNLGRREYAARTVHIFLGDGARLDAPLPVYGRHGITVAGADRANEVLDAFRRHTTVA